jgi:hypothetical protein
VVTAVDLDQLAEARASRARLVDLRRTLPARHPQAGIHHQPAHRFLRQPHTVALVQFLARQRRPEIGIAIPDDRDGPIGRHGIQPIIARLRAPARHQTGRSVCAQPFNQTANLTGRQPKPFCRAPRPEPAVRDVLNDLEAVQLSHRHRDPFRCSHQSLRRAEQPATGQLTMSPKADI